MKIRIFKPHTHAGKRYEPGPEGVELDVNEHDAKFIRDRGLHERPKPDLPAATTPTDIR